MRDTERESEAETQAEGEAGSMQGARITDDLKLVSHKFVLISDQFMTFYKCLNGWITVFVLVFFLRFYLFIHERPRERERGRDAGRGRSRLPAGSLTWDLIPGPRGHDLSQRQMLWLRA